MAEGRKEVRGENELAIGPKVTRLDKNMYQLAETPKEIKIIDESGSPILTKDHDRRFFEGAWVYKYNNKYYFTYSTGDMHRICYAIGNSPYGPFTYKGVILNLVKGWATHHSIVKYNSNWYLHYHDTKLSGKSHLRNIKVALLKHLANDTVKTIDSFVTSAPN